MKIPIIHGVYAGKGTTPIDFFNFNRLNDSRFGTSYPVNMRPFLSGGRGEDAVFLSNHEGIEAMSGPITGGGAFRGGVHISNGVSNSTYYLVFGTNLFKLTFASPFSPNYNILGSVGGRNLSEDAVRVNYSFDRVSVSSGGALYYYVFATSEFIAVSTVQTGYVLDHVWIDGYFIVTDGQTIANTLLSDPTLVSPTSYAGSELSPDPITGLQVLRNELWVINRHTCEPFRNVGGAGFPFQRIDGAQIYKGCPDRRLCKVFDESIAFVGSGAGEPLGVYLARNGNVIKISTPEIDTILNLHALNEVKFLETRKDRTGASLLYVVTTRGTYVYDHAVSQFLETPVWFILTKSIQPESSALGYSEFQSYDACNFVSSGSFGDALVGEFGGTRIGRMTPQFATQWDVAVPWRFDTGPLYNEGRGALMQEIELVANISRTNLVGDRQINLKISNTGRWHTDPVFADLGSLVADLGSIALDPASQRRIVWFSAGSILDRSVLRFSGTSNTHIAVGRLEIKLEPLAW